MNYSITLVSRTTDGEFPVAVLEMGQFRRDVARKWRDYDAPKEFPSARIFRRTSPYARAAKISAWTRTRVSTPNCTIEMHRRP